MNPFYFFTVYIFSVTALCLVVIVPYISSNGYMLQERGNKDVSVPLCICVTYAIFLGWRPMHSEFGDTMSYGRTYLSSFGNSDVTVDWGSEWIWRLIIDFCHSLDFNLNEYFTFISMGYFLFALVSIWILTPKNVYVTLMFMLSSLFFYTFCINGMRNGYACHLTLLAIAIALRGNYPLAAVLAVVSFGIHKSTILPIAACIGAIAFKRDIKYFIWLWLACIPLSFFAGGFFISLFASLGFDERMNAYGSQQELGIFSSSGFRWDFLLYSSFPVLLAWFICVKKKVSDNWYNVLCSIYCLCNAFWILVIRAAYSNRFAYLSWFIYPIIIAYPLVMLPVWDDQDQKTAIILLAYIGFTLLLTYIWGMIRI